jgi:hypothetical protein
MLNDFGLRQYKKINPKTSIVTKNGIVFLYSRLELMQLNVRFDFLFPPPNGDGSFCGYVSYHSIL